MTEINHIGQLIPDPKNARKHNERNIKQIVDSLQEVGGARSIVIDENNVILAGNGVTEAAAIAGIENVRVIEANGNEIIAVRRSGLTEEQKTRLALWDNRAAELAEWDADVLTNLYQEDASVFDNMFSAKELDNIIGDLGEKKDAEPHIDRAAELNEKWQVKTGDLWKIGEHRLLCGDSTNIEDVDKLMGGEKADILFTDPPYGVAYVGKTKDALTIENDDVDEEKLKEYVLLWFNVCDYATRDGSYWLATVPPGPLHEVFLSDWKRRGILRQVMVWVKNSMVMGHSEYHYKHEPILFGWKSGDRLKNEDRTKTTVWEFDRPSASREHPTMKPVDMWEYGIGQHSNAGDISFEPFCGSGTNMIACENLKRKCRAIEIDPDYCAVILERMATAFPGIEIERIVT